MHSKEAISKHIRALRSEVDRQHQERHRAIDTLEADLLGTTREREPVQQIQPRQLSNGRKSNVALVLDAIPSGGFANIQDIMESTGLDEAKVRAALHSAVIKRQTQSKKVNKRLSFTRVQEVPRGKRREAKSGSASSIVLQLIKSHPNGMTAGQIGDAVLPLIKTDAKRPRNTVSTCLLHLKRSGAVFYDSNSKLYRPERA